MSEKIRLLLADDQQLVRSALAALLELDEAFEVVAQVGRGDQVVGAAREHPGEGAVGEVGPGDQVVAPLGEPRAGGALPNLETPGVDGLAAAAALAQEVPQ